MNIKSYKFTKRLTLLFIKELVSSSDNKLVEKFGSVIFAENVSQGLKLFNKNYIDLVVIELENNYVEKFELIQKIRKIRPFVLVIILSKDTEFNTLTKTMELGIDGYFNHPIENQNFLEKINKLEERYQVAEEYENNKENINLLKQYQDITDKSSIISKTDTLGKITYANDNFCKVSGYTKNELLGKNHNIIRHPDTPKEIFGELWDTIKRQKKQWNGIVRNLAKTGESYYVKSMITPILNQEGGIVEYIALRQNISSILSDKKHFLDKIESNILSLLILVHIEEFEMLEKFYNLTTIDKVEKMFGFKLLSYLPKDYKFDNVYNLDNGKYALLADLDHFMKTDIQIDAYLQEFVNNVKQSILDIEGIEYDINISLSYTFGKHMLYEDAKAGLDEVVDKNMIICHSNDFSIRHQKEAKKNLDVIKMVKIALDNYNIISYFQPIINNKTQIIEKYESLVRLVDEEGKVLTPYEFLNISKKGVYYNKITHRVLENSFKMLKTISTKLSINLSTIDIEKESTREKIFQLLEEYKEDKNRLIFELLEDENIKDFDTIIEFIKNVKAQGVSIAIDDFGAGYSNFERLLKFEPDILKIDGSIVKNIVSDTYSRNLIETIVSFAKKQNIETVAEYVESKEIFEHLKELGVDYSQGYYFGKPEELILR